jgi:hypothetical protein
LRAAAQTNCSAQPILPHPHRPNHPGPLKELMAMAGRDVGRARPPLAPMRSEERALAGRALAAAAPVE